MTSLLADCKLALRLYRRTPVASLIAVVVLAVGTAFVGAFLSLYVDMVLKPFRGIEDSDRLVTIALANGQTVPFGVTERMSEEVGSLEAVVGVFRASNLAVGRDGEGVTVEFASRGFFDGIRPKLALGRGIEPAEHDLDAEPVVVISDRYWRARYGRRPDVLGEPIELVPQQQNAQRQVPTEFRIVGVMGPELRGMTSDDIDLWAPFERILPLIAGAVTDYEQARAQTYMHNFGRLRPGATAEGLVREIEARLTDSTVPHGLAPGTRVDAVDGVVRDTNVHRDAERQLKLFLTGSVLLALVAAANTSLFLLARAPGRRRELAIRVSLGAPIKRLARQLASEAALLVAAGALLGLVASVWLESFLRGMDFLRRADWSDVTLLDWRVSSLVGIFLLILTLLVSLAPMLTLKRLSLAASGRLDAARATRAQRLTGTVQLAVAGALGGAALAFVWFLVPVVFGDPGFEIENRHAVLFVPSSFDEPSDGGTAPDLRSAVIDAARQREAIEALPGVRAVTLSHLVPGGQDALVKRQVPDPRDPSRDIAVGYSGIDSPFVDVLGLRVLHGRAPTEDEIGASLVNQALARRFFGRDDVVGESLDLESAAGSRTRIVGVLEDLSFLHPAAAVEPMVFMNLPPPFVVRGVIESPLPPAVLQRQLQTRFESGELELGRPSVVRSLRDLRDVEIAPDRARGMLTIGMAVLVVLLAAFGFYGTQHYLVTAGRREYAIRASLGAGPGALVRLVFRRGFALGLPGLVLGAPLAFIVVAWLRDDFLSHEISPGIVAGAVVIGLTLLTFAASLGPARLARRTEPAPLLRED